MKKVPSNIISPLASAKPGSTLDNLDTGLSMGRTQKANKFHLFRLWIATLAILAGGLSQGLAQTFLIDFGAAALTTEHGPAPDDPVYYWNNVTDAIGSSSTAQLPNLVTTLNATSVVNFVMVSRFNGANEVGTLEPTLFPTDATRDSLYGNTELWGTLENIFPSFKLTGLDSQTVYDLTFYASRTQVTDNRETGYTIVGATTEFAAFDPANNVAGFVTVSNLVPSAAGEITISLAPTANNNNGNHFTYIGVLKIDAIPPQTPLTFTLEPVNTRAIEFESATFTSAVDGPPPYFIQWYSNDVAIPDANQFTYTIPLATLDMDGAFYSVSVSNLAFGVTSSNALLRVVNDTEPPTVVSVTGIDGFTIEIVFSELMDFLSTIDTFAYAVNEGTVTVANADLGADGKTVTLTLLDGPISGDFSVILGGQKDVSLNPIPLGTTVTGRVLGPEDQKFFFDFGDVTTLFGPSPDDPDNYWNNVTASIGNLAGNQMPSLISTRNIPAPLGLTILSRFNGFNGSGIVTSGILPSDATRDSLFGNTELFGGLENIFPSFKLTGVYPDVSYKLTFFASRTGVGDNRETGYTVVGDSTYFTTLNPANNIANVTEISGVKADAAGEITISLAPTANNNNANHFTYIGVLKLEPVQVERKFMAPAIQDGQLTLEWTGNGELEWAPSIDGPWTKVTPSAKSPYSEAIVPGENRLFRLNDSF
jgi:hypothetical protein